MLEFKGVSTVPGKNAHGLYFNPASYEPLLTMILARRLRATCDRRGLTARRIRSANGQQIDFAQNRCAIDRRVRVARGAAGLWGVTALLTLAPLGPGAE